MSRSMPQPWSTIYQGSVNVAPIKSPTDNHDLEKSTFNDACPAGAKTYYSNTKAINKSSRVLRPLGSHIQYCAQSRKSSLKKLSSHSFTYLQPFRILDLPSEIRLEIYKLVVGVNQRIQISCGVKESRQSTLALPTPSEVTITTYIDGYDSEDTGYNNRQSTVVSYDLHGGKQQITTKKFTPRDESVLDQGNASTGLVQDLRLLRTCRQIYDEASSVLYYNNTFVFLSPGTFTAYFGLITPEQVYVPRSTEPDRMRAIQAMTKIEVCGIVGRRPFLDILSASRLIRTGLGCLTSLASLELSLELYGKIDLQDWKIDDCMFSKPSSLNKLVVDVRSSEYNREQRLAGEKNDLDIAEELVHRILKQEDFTDTVESF